MKTTIKPKPYISDCSVCGSEEVQTPYMNFNEIPEEGVELTCDDCMRSGEKPQGRAERQVYYKSCGHKDALANTMPVITDLVIVHVRKKRKEYIRAECGNCSG